MTVFCLGSINADHVYQVSKIPQPGETITSKSLTTGLGGKGANQSVAAAKAGSKTTHIGAVGKDGGWAIAALGEHGIDTAPIMISDQTTGHAIINVDPAGENAIVVHAGANADIKIDAINHALSGAGAGDYILMQNETNAQVETIKAAQRRGIKTVYSAAPFDPAAVRLVLPYIDILCVNEIEAAQLATAFGKPVESLGLETVLITRGRKGASLFHLGKPYHQAAFPVTPVDTTGAGDTFAGYLIAALEQGQDPAKSLGLAAAAAAIQVTRQGASAAIPSRAEVDEFLAKP